MVDRITCWYTPQVDTRSAPGKYRPKPGAFNSIWGLSVRAADCCLHRHMETGLDQTQQGLGVLALQAAELDMLCHKGSPEAVSLDFVFC